MFKETNEDKELSKAEYEAMVELHSDIWNNHDGHMNFIKADKLFLKYKEHYMSSHFSIDTLEARMKFEYVAHGITKSKK